MENGIRRHPPKSSGSMVWTQKTQYAEKDMSDNHQDKKSAPGSNAELLTKITAQFHKAHQFGDHNAYIYLAKNAALAQAKALVGNDPTKSPLYGMTLAIKDNIEVAGMTHSVGHKSLEHYIPASDADVVAQLKKAGAIINGKTNMHELALGITSNNGAFGPVKNAYNASCFAGGSSGGTATAIALGLADAGIGTDTGGSTRIPAALNGIVGFRPTTGRYSSRGISLLSQTRDTAGPMAANVETVALLDSVMAQEPAVNVNPYPLYKLRLGMPKAYFFDNISPEITDRLEKIISKLQAAGVQWVDVDLSDVAQLSHQSSFTIVLYEARQQLENLLKRAAPQLSFEQFVSQTSSPDVKALLTMLLEDPIADDAYHEAIDTLRPKLQKAYKDCFESHQLDALIFPATPLPAQPILGSDETVYLNGQQVSTFSTFIQNTDPSSNAGIPSLVIPMGLNSGGLPIALQIDGPAGSDQHLLAIGASIENMLKTKL
ncbi:MAG: Asp-tRNA(Asn)/Glu-tRNA(Gln) amidotransferase A subunit family amidase [Paraglaciecola sp.]